MAYTATRHAYHESTAVDSRATRSVSVFGDFVVYLVKGREDVVGELDLCYRLHTFCCCTYSEPNKTLFAKRRVEDAFCSKVCCQVHGAPEHTAKLYILPKYQYSFIGLQCMP